MKLARHCAVLTYTYYLANVILFNKPYFQIKINNFQRVPYNTRGPEAWNIHGVTYYLANVILFNKPYFQIKINNFQRVPYNTRGPEAWNIHGVIVMFQHE